MCGISGYNWNDKGLILKMNECLAHRGPDASGVFSEDGITLGHRRLAIIDLSPVANQPMKDASGELAIVFNGEIYNYRELRRNLEGDYVFATQSDTEVILAGYKKWGSAVTSRLNGIFAFAIWDRVNRTLFVARDHMGVKPLYYYWDGMRLIFSSEVSGILAHDIPRVLDHDAFNAYLRVLYVPEPKTMIQNISKLPPGSSLLLRGRELTIERYYSPQLTSGHLSYSSARHAVHDAVHKAVERQLVADVPVGVYLSGGIDSSAILASVTSVKKNVKTFSVGFDLEEGEEQEKFNRDFDLARETAAHFGAEHHPLLLSVKDIASSLESIVGHLDDPISHPTAIPMAHLSRFARREVTVALSGNGGDELFGGYERYRMSRRADLVSMVPGGSLFLPERIQAAIRMSALDRLAQFEFEKDKRLSKVIAPGILTPMKDIKSEFSRYVDSTLDKTTSLMLADLQSWLPDYALLLGDKMSMYGSLEERVPLLDRDVVDLALSLPLGYKVTPFSTKKILKDAFRSELPAFLYKEPKRGWFSPGAKWLRRPEIEHIAREALSKGYYAPTSGLFDWAGVHSMLEKHLDKTEYNLTLLWALMTFQIWARTHKVTV